MLQQLDLFGEPSENQPETNAPKTKGKYKIVPPAIIINEEQSKLSDLEEIKPQIETPGINNEKKFNQKLKYDYSTINIPDDDILFSKQYYPISEVAKMLNVNISLLRFWEGEFDIIKPRKTRKGDRLFRPEDVKNLKLIYFLLKEKKYTIEGAKSFIKKSKYSAEKYQAIESLKKLKQLLLEFKSALSD